MIENLILDSLFSSLRVILILFPLFLLFEGVSRRLDALISARVGPSLAVGWIDYLKTLTKTEKEKSVSLWHNSFFVLATAMFSLVPWFSGSMNQEFELRLHLYFSITVLFLGTHFLFLYRRTNTVENIFSGQEIYVFFLMITVIVLNESSLILLRQNESQGFLSAVAAFILFFMQAYLGLVLFYFRSDSKENFERKTVRSGLIFFNFSKFVAGMSWICLHFSFIHPEKKITLFGFGGAFIIFIGFRLLMEGYTRLNEKLSGLITWKYFFPTSLTLFLLILLGDWFA